jgi:hypothetical protein
MSANIAVDFFALKKATINCSVIQNVE